MDRSGDFIPASLITDIPAKRRFKTGYINLIQTLPWHFFPWSCYRGEKNEIPASYFLKKRKLILEHLRISPLSTAAFLPASSRIKYTIYKLLNLILTSIKRYFYSSALFSYRYLVNQ
jgi:hypothetical protein